MKSLKKIFKLFVYYTFSVLVFCSCVTQKQRERICNGCKIISIDSVKVVEKIVLKDTTIYISSLPVIQYIINPCDTFGNLKPIDLIKINNGIKSTIKNIGGVLIFECEADSLKIKIVLLEKERDFYKGSLLTKESVTNILTAWQRFCIKGFYWLLGALIVWCSYKIIRAYYRV